MSAPTVERNHEGAWVVSDIIGGYLVVRRFYGYTRREAVQLFRQEARTLS